MLQIFIMHFQKQKIPNVSHKKTRSNIGAVSDPLSKSTGFLNCTFNIRNSKNSCSKDPGQVTKAKVKMNQIIDKDKENIATKTYNLVHSYNASSVVDEPQIVNYVLECIPKFRKEPKTHRDCRGSMEKSSYQIGQKRKDLQELQNWRRVRFEYHKKDEQNGLKIVTECINLLNMFFGELNRIVSTDSTQLSNMYSLLQKEYESFYEYVFDCMAKHNVTLHKEREQIDNRLHETIEYYEEKLLRVRQEFSDHSQKIVENFHKCIRMRKDAEKELKEYKKHFREERNKSKILEEGLQKLVEIFSAWGYQLQLEKMNVVWLNNYQRSKQPTGSSLDQNALEILKNLPTQAFENQTLKGKKALLHQWCGFISKLVQNFAEDDRKNKKQRKFEKFDPKLVQKKAVSAIKKFIVENDQDLSLNDAEELLKRFTTDKILLQSKEDSGSENEIMEQEKQKRIMTLDDAYRELCVPVHVEMQTDLDYSDGQVQTYVNSNEYGVMVVPKCKTKAVITNISMPKPFKLHSKVVHILQQPFVASVVLKSKKMILTPRSGTHQPVSFSKLALDPSSPSKSRKSISKSIRKSIMEKKRVSINQNSQKSRQQMGHTGETGEKKSILRKKTKTANKLDNVKHASKDKFSIKTIGEGQENLEKNSVMNSLKMDSELSSESNHGEKKYAKSSVKYVPKERHHHRKQPVKPEDIKSIRSNIKDKSNKSIKSIKSNKSIKFINATKIEDLEYEVARKRSFYCEVQRQFSNASKIQRHFENKVSNCAIKVSKKRQQKQKLIDRNELNLQLIQRKYEKIKCLTQVQLWNPKRLNDLKKMSKRIRTMKNERMETTQKNYQLLLDFLEQVVNPILLYYIRDFKIMMDSNYPQSKVEPKMETKRISYYHKLAPLLYLVLNSRHYYNKAASETSRMYYRGLKSFRQMDPRLEVYDVLMEGGTVELDIFAKSFVLFNLKVNMNFGEKIKFLMIEQYLEDIVGEYCTATEIQEIKQELQGCSRAQEQSCFDSSLKSIFFQKNSNLYFVQFHVLVKVICRHIRLKYNKQKQRYSIFKDLISKETICTYYQDVLLFLYCLPLDNLKRNRILQKVMKYLVYWEKVEPMIPSDRLYFIFDEMNLEGNRLHQKPLINEYLVNCAELNYMGTMRRITKSNDWVIEETYKISYRVPKLFHRVIEELKNPRERSLKYALLTLMYCNVVYEELTKAIIPALANGLIAIPIAN